MPPLKIKPAIIETMAVPNNVIIVVPIAPITVVPILPIALPAAPDHVPIISKILDNPSGTSFAFSAISLENILPLFDAVSNFSITSVSPESDASVWNAKRLPKLEPSPVFSPNFLETSPYIRVSSSCASIFFLPLKDLMFIFKSNARLASSALTPMATMVARCFAASFIRFLGLILLFIFSNVLLSSFALSLE